jgi:hypothetical protein
LNEEVMAMSEEDIRERPERVIILDADDPMTEVTGRFVWQEEHERVVENARRAAFEAGFEAGLREPGRAVPPSAVHLELRRRRGLANRLRLALVVVALVCLLIALPVLVLAG